MDRSALAECVLPHTVAVASAFDSRITLAHVMESRNRANWRRAVDPLNWRIRKAEVATYMDDLARRVQTAGVPAETQILEGASAEQIVEFSRTNDVPLIMLSSHGQSGLTGWNVSSVVQKVILRAHTSFMIIRAYQPTSTDIAGLHYHRLLVPVDGSQRARDYPACGCHSRTRTGCSNRVDACDSPPGIIPTDAARPRGNRIG